MSQNWHETMAVIDGAPDSILFPYDDDAARTVFTPQARLAAQDLGDARIREGMRITISVLERIAAECHGRARLLVLLIPTKSWSSRIECWRIPSRSLASFHRAGRRRDEGAHANRDVPGGARDRDDRPASRDAWVARTARRRPFRDEPLPGELGRTSRDCRLHRHDACHRRRDQRPTVVTRPGSLCV
jgi:hypothetical protein